MSDSIESLNMKTESSVLSETQQVRHQLNNGECQDDSTRKVNSMPALELTVRLNSVSYHHLQLRPPPATTSTRTITTKKQQHEASNIFPSQSLTQTHSLSQLITILKNIFITFPLEKLRHYIEITNLGTFSHSSQWNYYYLLWIQLCHSVFELNLSRITSEGP